MSIKLNQKQYFKARLFCLILLFSPLSICSQEQENWVLLRWPLREVVNLENDITSQEFENAWHENRIFRHLQKELSIEGSTSDSLDVFLTQLHELNPQCIEADWAFASKHLVAGKYSYVPVLRFRNRIQSEAELIWNPAKSPTNETLGVVSPDLPIGGGLQINHLNQKYATNVQLHVFFSPKEVIRQLLVGSIYAAATPAGYFDLMLRTMERTDLSDRFQRERFYSMTQRVYWLREDIYRDVFKRTVVIETWLRDRFTEKLEPFTAISSNELN